MHAIRVFFHGFLLVALALTVAAGRAAEESRGMGVVQAPGGVPARGANWLLLIAIDHYADWPRLTGPTKDAQALENVLLRRYAFDTAHTIRLYDEQATKTAIMKRLQALSETIAAEDSLLIFYAGHGFTDPFSKTGYWVPTDGGADKVDKAHWIPNVEIRGYMKLIKAAHVLIIADSCFSGDLLDSTRQPPADIRDDAYITAWRYRSRQVLTSGASQPVADTSAFSFHLIAALERNTEPYIGPYGLYEAIQRGVKPPQLPLLGALADAGHEVGGSYLFFLRREFAVATPAQPAAEPPAPVRYAIELATFGGDTDCAAEVSPAKSAYAWGEKVTFTARPSKKYSFEGWSGGIEGQHPVKTVEIHSDLHVTAVFHRTPPAVEPPKPVVMEPPRKAPTPATPSDWGIALLGGASAATGVAGGELRWRHFALDLGYVPDEPVVGGVKFYAEPEKDSFFLGIVGGYKNENEDRGEGRVIGLVLGYRWVWSSHIALVLGAGAGIFQETEVETPENKYMFLPDVAIGMAF